MATGAQWARRVRAFPAEVGMPLDLLMVLILAAFAVISFAYIAGLEKI